jgi:pyruvate dehydrogenase E2 component (dihydrolipoamide acetyltransferase)
MANKMLMPLLGQTMEEGTIIKWFKSEGDEIKAGEPLLEVMTDKVNMEVEAPEDGVLRKILAQPDDIVPVKEPICIIGTRDEPIDHLLGSPPDAPEFAASTATTAATVPEEPPAVEAQESAPVVASGGRVMASPAAKRVAREHGIDLALLAGRGTGPNGRIVEKDVIGFVAAAPKATPVATKVAADLGVPIGGIVGTGVAGKVTVEDVQRAAAVLEVGSAKPLTIGGVIPFAGMRKAVAQNVSASIQTAVHVTLVTEVDMTQCVALREQILDSVEKRYGVRISYTDIIAKAVAKAIEEKPIVNSSLQGDQIVIHDRVNIGIATAIEGGLVVPVVKDVQSKSLVQVAVEIKDAVARARSGHATNEDYQGGTISITNLGAYGIDTFNPVITPGQAAILGVCRIAQKPVVVDGEIAIRSMMNLCLTFDHRIMDGAPAAEYLAALKSILETPYLILV